MSKFLSKYAKWIIAAFGLLVFGVTETDWLQSLTLWQRPEGISIDFRYALRGAKNPDPNIQLVGLETSSFQLDELSSNEIAASPTLQLMLQPWPWDRRVYAAILDKLMSSGAKVVVFDFVFASQTDGDDEFARALQKYKDRVAIGEMFADEEQTDSKTKKLTEPNSDLLPNGTNSIVGLVNMWTDPDEVVRRVKYRTSLEHESGLDGLGAPENLIHISAVAVDKFTGQELAPSDDALHFIDFQGGPGTYRPFAVEDMFVDELWKAPPFNGGLTFSNKIVVVGPIAEIFHDNHQTPFGDMPGPELQAQIMAALLRHSWLEETPPPVNFALAVLMLLIGLGICLQIRSAIYKPLLLVATVVIFFIGCQIAFNDYKLVLPMTQPLCCLAVPAVFGMAFQFALEQIERLRTRNLLERYVSKNVAKTILEDQRSFLESLSGRKQAVTVLFSDIRGFTSMTETADADKLVAQLNEYFLEMVGIVLKENGTLQKFIGDAIMSAWGDTHSEGLAEDARRAVNAALQMRAALMKLNERWAAQPDRKNLKIGIGVNHGEIIVGNIGHPQRMEFTVLGDGVNLASRLESATKQFHTDILIGEETEKLTREFFVYRNVGAIAFKGKTRPVETYVVLSDRTVPAPGWLAKYHEGIQKYRSRKFDLALAIFEEVKAGIGGEDFLCDMYLEACHKHLGQALPEDWDGSFTLSEK
ncbi:MAG: CHASE2 domain-containing protein [Limisphaerales bacterium]